MEHSHIFHPDFGFLPGLPEKTKDRFSHQQWIERKRAEKRNEEWLNKPFIPDGVLEAKPR